MSDGASAPAAAGHSGKPLPRAEDARFLTGRARYVGDFKLPGLVHAALARSQVAHGRLLRVDAGAARSAPGVLLVLTAADIPETVSPIPVRTGALPGIERCLQAPLARDRVRYVGEPVALVVARDRYLAEDAAESIGMEIEPLPAVVTMADALGDRAVIHPAAATNVASRHVARRGDADAAFARADYVRTERLRTHRHASVPLETRGIVARWDGAAGRLVVWGAAKVPHFNRALLAAMLGLPREAVDLVELDVGGSFGARGEFYPEDFLVPLAARVTGLPVKWIEDRLENLLAMNHSREMECELSIAARRDGRILGLRGRLHADLGAYARTTGVIGPAKAGAFLPGPYAIDDYACEIVCLVTNKTPAGTYRGPGRYEANYFRERMIDLMAADLGLDPAAVRMANLIPAAAMPYPTGPLVPYEKPTEYDTGDYPAALARALELADYPALRRARGRARDGRLHGVGIGCFVDSSGAGPAESARLIVRGGGDIELHTGCSSSGQGHETTFAQVLADVLGVAPATIRVLHGSTTHLREGWGTYHGRGLVMGGNAARQAGETFIGRLLAEARRRTGLAPDRLAYRSLAVVNAESGEPLLTVAALEREAWAGGSAAAEVLDVEARYEQHRLTFEYGVQVAHVAVDPATCEVEVVRFVTVEDCGNVINPMIVHGQVIGAAVQGLSGTLLEEFRYDRDGQMLSGTFADYLIARSTDFPAVEAASVNFAPALSNPLGAKGAGEGGIEATGAAVANAVADALRPLGVTVRALPLSPDNLARLIRDARAGRF
ncbi:MAG: xanthine dehydrogenase family protein molybdopterin-binding subunit [Burkholderiales bacterium]|nr:xanthine dehydrogenase family protein molybdopterin-binding subunit [Burkholderiales bacterium]